jgi:catecholate siderophore receptor
MAAAGMAALGFAAPGASAAAPDGAEAGAAAFEVTPVDVIGQRETYAPKASSTATKTETPLLDTPQSVSVVTDLQIRDQSLQGMSDLLRYVPGVGVSQGEGNRDNPVLRGNASTADFFVDGVRDDVQYLRDLYNAERVEVLKGPNAMIFGRGGGGGVINRVTKRADGRDLTGATVETGSFDHRRVTADLARGAGDTAAGRLTGVYERSESYRDFTHIERWGLNPTARWAPTAKLTVDLSYEHFHDGRTADRGIPSFAGAPSPAADSTFFGDPDQSYVRADVNLAGAVVSYAPRADLTIRNHTLFGDYEKFYQNIFAGGAAVAGPSGAPATVPLQAYNNATQRQNLFNQTDVVWKVAQGSVKHTLLAGAEFGRQETDNFRNTGYFGGVATSLVVPFASPTLHGTPMVFRQAATDADNHVMANIAAAYAQDQVEIGPHVQLIAGVRYDRFDLDFANHRTGDHLGRVDNLVSPRLGLVLKPIPPVSLYASYSVSYLPSAGDQFSSLTATTETLKPERFENHEVGAKWDLASGLSLTAALYELTRDNTSAPDPQNPSRIVQTGSQRSRGVEFGVLGQMTDRWQVAGGYAWQDAEITSRTSAAAPGQQVALTPHNMVSLWNKVRLDGRWSLGLGVIHQSKSFAAIDNTVTLPGFTRVDAAVFVQLTERIRAQANIENLFDAGYVATAQGNNNILPGSPRAVRISLSAAL